MSVLAVHGLGLAGRRQPRDADHPDMTFRIVKSIAASRGSWDIPGWFSMRSIEHQTFEQSNDWVPAFEETYSDRFG